MECSGKGVFVAEESAKFNLESGSELGSMIGNNLIVKSVI